MCVHSMACLYVNNIGDVGTFELFVFTVFSCLLGMVVAGYRGAPFAWVCVCVVVSVLA